MGYMTTKMLNSNARFHLETAKLLMQGVTNSADYIWSVTRAGEQYPEIPPEHSKESIKRRCVQIRQELLIVMKELEK